MNMNATENNVYAMQKDYGGEMRKIERQRSKAG